METARVIQATFADWRTVKGRKQLQIILEVPLEKQGEVLTMLGAPDPANPTWCAVAVLDLSKPQPLSATREVRTTELAQVAQRTEHRTSNSGVDGSNPSLATTKERRPFNSLPLSQQAAIRCQDRDFQEYLSVTGAEAAAKEIRDICGIESRAELNTHHGAAATWRKMEDQYQAYLTDRMYPEEARR